MRLLLDSHALLWWLADDPTLDPTTRAVIAAPENEVLVSVASVWEIEIKRAIGRLEAPDDLIGAAEGSGLRLLSIDASHAVAAARLARVHADPFDRLLIAQAQLEDLTLVTRDSRMAEYGIPILPA